MNKPSTIDRATLLKGTGTAALATLLAALADGRADACCSPIDLTFTDDPVAAMTTTKRKPHAQAITAIRLWSSHGPGVPPPQAPWELLFTIPTAHVNGNDENGNPHGNGGKPKPLGYTINVYVQY
jgi:hypothetical protein